MAKRFLVTGGGGYIGRHVVSSLVKKGFEVYVIQTGSKKIANARVIKADIFSGDANIFEKVGKPDVLVHLAWKDGFRHNSPTHIEDLHKHYIFIRDMLAGGLRHFVGMGSVHEVGYHEGVVDALTPTQPLSLYGVAKNSLRAVSELLAKEAGAVYQWIRGYYVIGDDERSQSVFNKILTADQAGSKQFPFVTGDNKYDFIDVADLAEQIVAVASQSAHTGIINCCSGKPESIASRVERFLAEHNLNIKLEYGVFPDREYDSPAIWGDNTTIRQILAASEGSSGLENLAS